jgi:hypothetical protein
MGGATELLAAGTATLTAAFGAAGGVAKANMTATVNTAKRTASFIFIVSSSLSDRNSDT